MKETSVSFGPTKALSGVLTEPTAGGAGRPAVLLLNAGLLHRIGPNRLYVTIARRLAAAGLPVLRFDFSGLGESEPRRDELSLEQASLAEGREAMDFLVASGVADRFVPMGLCAGAENAQRLAEHDPRVVGAVLIDGYAYRTPGYYLRHFGRRAMSGRSWRNIGPILHRVLRQKPQPAPAGGNPGGLDFVREFPPRAACLADLQTIVARRVNLFLIFTGGGMTEYYNYAAQFGDTFPALRGHPRIRVEFIDSADHTFTLLSDQRLLLAAIDDWMTTVLVGESNGAGIKAP